MAPAVVTAVPVPVPPKIKRPPPPSVQTNGAPPSQSSPSPSISTKKPPPIATAKQNQVSNSAGPNLNGAPGGSSRPAVPRSRRDTLTASGTRGQKNNSALRSTGSGQDKTLSQAFEPRPEGLLSYSYVRTLNAH
jgi:transcription factor SPT20